MTQRIRYGTLRGHQDIHLLSKEIFRLYVRDVFPILEMPSCTIPVNDGSDFPLLQDDISRGKISRAKLET